MFNIICVYASIFGPETEMYAFQPHFLITQPKFLFKSSLALEFWGSYQPKLEIPLPEKNIFLHLCTQTSTWLLDSLKFKVKFNPDDAYLN